MLLTPYIGTIFGSIMSNLKEIMEKIENAIVKEALTLTCCKCFIETTQWNRCGKEITCDPCYEGRTKPSLQRQSIIYGSAIDHQSDQSFWNGFTACNSNTSRGVLTTEVFQEAIEAIQQAPAYDNYDLGVLGRRMYSNGPWVLERPIDELHHVVMRFSLQP